MNIYIRITAKEWVRNHFLHQKFREHYWYLFHGNTSFFVFTSGPFQVIKWFMTLDVVFGQL
jgi:hypothetical protein